jgi:hypothetical protein
VIHDFVNEPQARAPRFGQSPALQPFGDHLLIFPSHSPCMELSCLRSIKRNPRLDADLDTFFMHRADLLTPS